MSTALTADDATRAAAPEPVTEKRTRRRRIPGVGVVLGATWLLALIVLAFTADYLPFIRFYDRPVRGAAAAAFGPGNDFWFGSDSLGRDVFARCIYGAKTSLTISVASILVGTIVGGTLGVMAGYYRGWVDRVISIFTDALLALPAIIIASLLVGRFDVLAASDADFLGFGFSWLTRTWSVTIVFSLLSIAPVARIVRAQTLSISQREYVLAARSLGAGTRRVLVREIVPNVIPALTAVIFTGIAILLAAEGGLAFLGYSVPDPPSWGSLIADSREQIEEAWWMTIFPCIMLFLTVLSFNLVGDRVARRFDIREAAL
ncbi:MAG: ABC transporter permease [Actinomycetota bacterium]|nr:ABC transporter permease [Actinomycetota bacterium]